MELIVSHITKAYGEKTVLEDVSLTFESGGRYRISGPSGRGKTTLLRLILGLEKPQSGTVTGIPDRKAAVFQEDRLLEGYTALENLRFVTGRQYTTMELSGLLRRLLPEDALKKPVHEFSGGMKRRTAILRALLAPSDIIIMDEPFTGLDAETKLAAIQLIKEYSAGKLLLISTHNAEDAELLSAEIITLGK